MGAMLPPVAEDSDMSTPERYDRRNTAWWAEHKAKEQARLEENKEQERQAAAYWETRRAKEHAEIMANFNERAMEIVVGALGLRRGPGHSASNATPSPGDIPPAPSDVLTVVRFPLHEAPCKEAQLGAMLPTVAEDSEMSTREWYDRRNMAWWAEGKAKEQARLEEKTEQETQVAASWEMRRANEHAELMVNLNERAMEIVVDAPELRHGSDHSASSATPSPGGIPPAPADALHVEWFLLHEAPHKSERSCSPPLHAPILLLLCVSLVELPHVPLLLAFFSMPFSRMPDAFQNVNSVAGALCWRALVGRDRSSSLAGSHVFMMTGSELEDVAMAARHVDRIIRTIRDRRHSFYVGITRDPARRLGAAPREVPPLVTHGSSHRGS